MGFNYGMCSLIRLIVLISILAPAVFPVASAHPISVTEAHVYVTRTSARMRIQLFAEDLFLFHDLEPNDMDVLSQEELKRGLSLHREFLLKKVTLRDAVGELYSGQVVDVQPFEIPEDGIIVDDLMLHSAVYELEFPFESPPEFLTLQQDISDENYIFPSEMKLTLHQAESELTYTENLKPGAATTLRFDWDLTQPGNDSSDEDWEKWFEAQREETLGITSYSSVYSFIYVEPAEVRHEILVPLASLKTVMPLEHKDPAFIEVDEQDAVRELIQEWLRDQNPAMINESVVQPEFTRIDFYGLDLKDFARQAEERKVSLASGRVGIILTYRPISGAVENVSLLWDRFHSSIRKIQSVVMTYPDQIQRFEFSRFNEEDENTFQWEVDPSKVLAPPESVKVDLPAKPQLQFSILSVLLLAILPFALLVKSRVRVRLGSVIVVAALGMWPVSRMQIPHPLKKPVNVSSDVATDAFQSLHRGMFRSLDFGTEDQIYDALEHSVDGMLLEDVYLQLRESLAIKEQGGAVARVQSVDYLSGELKESAGSSVEWPGFRYRSTWNVSGTVEHWGHIHERENQFSAVFTIEPRADSWKITDMQIEESKNVATRTRLRKF